MVIPIDVEMNDETVIDQSDILLLYPPGKTINYQSSIPYLAAYLVKHGYKVDVLDVPALKLTICGIISHVEKNPIKVIGVSIPFTPFSKIGFELIKTLRSSFPDVPIIFGRIHPTLVPEEFVDYVDFVCIGEGELTLKEFLDRYLKGEEYHNIKGIVFKENGETIYNEKRERVDLNTLPIPLWDVVEVARALSAIIYQDKDDG